MTIRRALSAMFYVVPSREDMQIAYNLIDAAQKYVAQRPPQLHDEIARVR